MQIEVFSLCDAATVDVAGKLKLALEFSALQSIERGAHKVSVNFVDIDGKHIIPPANGTININFSDEQRSGSTNLVFNLQMLKLEKYGEYSIDLAVDSKKEASLPVFILLKKG